MFLKKLENLLFYLLIFLLPTQLGLHFWPEWAFVFGVRVDYLAPVIYLTDVLVFLLISVSRTKVNHKILLTLLLMGLFNIFFSISPWVSFWKWIKVLELVYLAKYVYDNFEKFKKPFVAKVLSVSLLLVCVLGLLQFMKSSTIGGIFYLVGERTFGITTPGIALQNILGKDYLRIYSSFSHPNSLAGYLLLSLLFLLSVKKKDWLIKITSVMGGVVFLLTASLSSFVTVLLLPFLKKSNKYILVALILFSFSLPKLINTNHYPKEMEERITQSTLAGKLIQQNLLTGTGLGTFVINNPDLQPVHNIYLLVFSEVGIFGFMLFIYLLNKLLRQPNPYLLVILLIGLLDHYFLNLQQNQLLLAIVFGASLKNQKILKSPNG